MELYLLTYVQNHDLDGEGPEWTYVFQTLELLEAFKYRIVRAALEDWFEIEEDEFEDEMEGALDNFNGWADNQEFIHVEQTNLVACQRQGRRLALPGF